MLLHSSFDEAEIEKEKGVILEEMNVYLDAAALRLERLRPAAVRGSAARLGHPRHAEETIEDDRETFLSYLDTWYRPERMVVGIGGRIGDDLMNRLEELLGGIEARPTGPPAEVELPPDTSLRSSCTRRTPSRRT